MSLSPILVMHHRSIFTINNSIAPSFLNCKIRQQKIQGCFMKVHKADDIWTARKNLHKHAEVQRMIEFVKREEVDILLFCLLDRWFRPWPTTTNS